MRFARLSDGLVLLGLILALGGCNSGGTTSTGVSETAPDALVSSPVTEPRYLPPSGDVGEAADPDSVATEDTSSAPAKVVFKLTDAPNPAIDAAYVAISDVAVHKTGGSWFSVLAAPVNLDLLDLQNGVTALLGEISLEPGKYTQIRLTVDSGEVESGGEVYMVDIPSHEIKINDNIEVCGGGELEVVIDFDAEKSLSYNQGRDLFTMRPVLKVQSINASCPEVEEVTPPEDESGDGEDEEQVYSGALGWLSIVVPPLVAEDFSSITGVVRDVQIHDQGIGQVTTFTEDYEVDLLEGARLVVDPETGEPLYTVLVPPVMVPAGNLDQVRLLFESIVVVNKQGDSVEIRLPLEDEELAGTDLPEDSEAEDDPESDDADDELAEEEDGDGLKFFGAIEVCADELTVLKWNLDLSIAGLPFVEGENTVLEIHPVIQAPEVLSTCEPYEAAGDDPDDGGAEEGDPGAVGESEPEVI